MLVTMTGAERREDVGPEHHQPPALQVPRHTPPPAFSPAEQSEASAGYSDAGPSQAAAGDVQQRYAEAVAAPNGAPPVAPRLRTLFAGYQHPGPLLSDATQTLCAEYRNHHLTLIILLVARPKQAEYHRYPLSKWKGPLTEVRPDA